MGYRKMAKGKSRIPIVRNKVYGDIITAIRLKKVGLKDIRERKDKPKNLKDVDRLFSKKPKIKAHSVLDVQLKVLVSEGYVLEDKKGKKILYEVNWDRIIDDFIDYSIARSKSNSEVIRKHKAEFKKNFFFSNAIKLYFDNLGSQGFAFQGVVLLDHFKDIMEFDWFGMIIKDLMDKLKLCKLRSYKGDKVFYEELADVLGKQKAGEFKKFEFLVGLLPVGRKKDVLQMASYHFVNILKKKYF